MAKLILIISLFFCYQAHSISGVGSGDDCATCGSNMPQDVSAAHSMGDGQLSKIAMAVANQQGPSRTPNSDPLEHVYQSICANWIVNDWSGIEEILKNENLKMHEIYHKIKCSFENEVDTPLFFKATYDPINYRVTYKRLMRQFQKEGGEAELTCALTYLRYRNETMVEEVETAIETATLNNQGESDPGKRETRRLLISELRKVLTYWERHTSKHPLPNNGQNCPQW